MIEKIEHPAYENNVKKLNEVIDVVNNIGNIQIDTGFLATKNDLNNYVLNSAVGNEANKIPRYDAEGHLILPDGTEVYATDEEVGIPSSSSESTHFISINSDDSTAINYNGDGAVEFQAIAIGVNSNAEGGDSIAIGTDTYTYGSSTVVIGNQAVSNANASVVIGGAAEAQDEGSEAVAIGLNSIVEGNRSTAVGADSHAVGVEDSAFGQNSYANGKWATALGSYSNATGQYAVGIGYNAKASGMESIAISGADTYNHGPEASGTRAVALGTQAKSKGSHTVALGPKTVAEGTFSLAVGQNTKSYNYGSVAIGTNAATKDNIECAVAIGCDAIAMESDTVSFGHQPNDWINGLQSKGRYGDTRLARLINIADGIDNSDAVTVGQLNSAISGAGSSGSTHFIGINSSDSTDTNYNGSGAIGEDSIAIGNEAECHGYSSVAIGPNVKIYDDYCDFSVAIGCDTEVTAENAIAIGKDAKVNYVLDGIAIGQGAEVIGGDNCVAIGNGSIANDLNEFSIGAPAVNGGNAEFTRRITHVSDGINGTDAVTLSQMNTAIATGKTKYLGLNFDNVTSDLNYAGSGASGTCSIAAGKTAKSSGNYSLAIGYEAEATAFGAIAIGSRTNTSSETKAQALGPGAVALGTNAHANGQTSIAIGYQAIADRSTYAGNTDHGGIAIGNYAKALKNNSITIGSISEAADDESMALGDFSYAYGGNSVAIGFGSTAKAYNVVSFGHQIGDRQGNQYQIEWTNTLTRRLINISNGINDNDAVTVGQLNTAIEELRQEIALLRQELEN